MTRGIEMLVLVSGEGPTDCGTARTLNAPCFGADFEIGPMSILIDQIAEKKLEYSLLDIGQFGFVSKNALIQQAKAFKGNPKSISLPGYDQGRETGYYYSNARALARIALHEQQQRNSPVIAVLFRDADGTATSGRGERNAKRQSMDLGFKREGFETGVAMIPKPKSEAWFICALKQNPYQHCDTLEETSSGNDRSPNNLKDQLQKILSRDINRELLVDLVKNRTVDFERINMPSFVEFKNDLKDKLTSKNASKSL